MLFRSTATHYNTTTVEYEGEISFEGVGSFLSELRQRLKVPAISTGPVYFDGRDRSLRWCVSSVCVYV